MHGAHAVISRLHAARGERVCAGHACIPGPPAGAARADSSARLASSIRSTATLVLDGCGRMRPARKSDIFDAVAHPVRRKILLSLKDGARPAGELAAPFEISLPAVAQHLKVLREAALVQQHRQGRQIIYFLNPLPLKALYEWVEEF